MKKTIVVDGILTSYEDIGDHDKILLVLPGWMRTSADWTQIVKNLEEKYRILILDLPGFGLTQKSGKDWDTYDYANFVKAFLKKLNINKCALLGHSFGGRVAIILSATTELVEKLILVDSAGINEYKTAFKIKRWIVRKVLRPIGKMMPLSLYNRLRNRAGSRDYKSAGEMRKTFVKIVNQELKNLMPKIKIPTLIIWGENDDILDVRLAKKIHSLIPNSVMRIIWGSKHFPHLEKPKEFLEIIDEFL